MTEDWEKLLDEEAKRIKEWKLSDRLSYLAKICYSVCSITASVEGWNVWLSKPHVMETFNEKELTKLSEVFGELTLLFLDLDSKYTKIMQEREKEMFESESKIVNGHNNNCNGNSNGGNRYVS